MRKVLLISGVLAAILYIGTDILLSMSWTYYSYTAQTISELSAIGAPTRSLWIVMSFFFNPLVILFGIGVWKMAKEKSLRAAGILLTVWGILGFVWLFFPMHMRDSLGSSGSATDTMHIVMTIITVPLMMTFIALGSATQGKWFRIYSLLTIVFMLIFGVLTGMQAPKLVAQLPTPWMGITERISVYLPMLWMAALAAVLLRKNMRCE